MTPRWSRGTDSNRDRPSHLGYAALYTTPRQFSLINSTTTLQLDYIAISSAKNCVSRLHSHVEHTRQGFDERRICRRRFNVYSTRTDFTRKVTLHGCCRFPSPTISFLSDPIRVLLLLAFGVVSWTFYKLEQTVSTSAPCIQPYTFTFSATCVPMYFMDC